MGMFFLAFRLSHITIRPSFHSVIAPPLHHFEVVRKESRGSGLRCRFFMLRLAYGVSDRGLSAIPRVLRIG